MSKTVNSMSTANSFDQMTCEKLMKTRFKMLRVLGEGSYGIAVLVVDKETKKQCVIKRLNVQQKRRAMQESLNEISLLARLRHPNIVEFYSAWVEPDQRIHIGMEFCNGGDMSKYLADHFPVPEDNIRSFAVQLLLALSYMHKNHVIHRDIKLQNIFHSDMGNVVKLGDFGLSKLIDTTEEAAQTQVGTPFYFSPEIACGDPHTIKTDIWSLGVVLFQLLTNRTPFSGRGLVQVLDAIRHQPVPSPQKYVPSHVQYSQELCSLIELMLTKNFQDRPSADELLQLPWIHDLVVSTPWLLRDEQRRNAITMVLTKPNVTINIRAQSSLTSGIVGKLAFGDIIEMVKETRQENTARQSLRASKGDSPSCPVKSSEPFAEEHHSVTSSTASDCVPPPVTILWYEICAPVKGFCIGELEGARLFEPYDTLPHRHGTAGVPTVPAPVLSTPEKRVPPLQLEGAQWKSPGASAFNTPTGTPLLPPRDQTPPAPKHASGKYNDKRAPSPATPRNQHCQPILSPEINVGQPKPQQHPAYAHMKRGTPPSGAGTTSHGPSPNSTASNSPVSAFLQATHLHSPGLPPSHFHLEGPAPIGFCVPQGYRTPPPPTVTRHADPTGGMVREPITHLQRRGSFTHQPATAFHKAPQNSQPPMKGATKNCCSPIRRTSSPIAQQKMKKDATRPQQGMLGGKNHPSPSRCNTPPPPPMVQGQKRAATPVHHHMRCY